MTKPLLKTKDLMRFLQEASSQAWASGAKPQTRGDFDEYIYQKGIWYYRDSFIGSNPFQGTECVCHNSSLVYLMSYQGMLPEHLADDEELRQKIYDFLRRALLGRRNQQFSPRGENGFKADGYVYSMNLHGGASWFQGEEEISDGHGVVYRGNFFGCMPR